MRSPQIGQKNLVYENQFSKIYSVKADFGDFTKEYFVRDAGERAGVLVTQQGSVLLVRQYRLIINGLSWEIPGGKVDDGETLEEGAVRECLEETGVRTKFESLVCFRHWHQYRYGKSDIYFVCRLAPLSHEITVQADEIDECLWMPVDLYLESESVSPFNKRIVEAATRSPGLAPTGIEGYTDRDKYEFFIPMEMSDGNP